MSKEKNIYQRIAAVMEEVKYVQKTGWNGFHKYKYAKEADYIEGIRPALLKHGLVVTPYTEWSQQNGELTTVLVRYTITNIDNPDEKVEVSMPGAGSDKGDKGVYKALTGSKKYFIGTTFLIETGDDAEADESVDARAAGKPNLAPVNSGQLVSKVEGNLTNTEPAKESTDTAPPAPVEAKPKGASFRKVNKAAAKPAAVAASSSEDIFS